MTFHCRLQTFALVFSCVHRTFDLWLNYLSFTKKNNKGNAKRGVSPRLKIWPGDLDLWPWKSIGFQILWRTKHVPSSVKIHWRMLILVFTRMLRSKNLTKWPRPLTLKINRVPDSLKDSVCTKFGQNPLKDVDSRVFTRMLCGKNLIQWPWPLTLKINWVPYYLRTKYVPSLVKIHWRMLILVFTRMLRGINLTQWPWALTLKINRVPDFLKD
jgi:hypothetical protein